MQDSHSSVSDLLNSFARGISKDNAQEKSPLHKASSEGSLEGLESLLAEGVEVTKTDSEGKSALHYAASSGHSEIARVLLDHGAQISESDDNGETPLQAAAANGSVASIMLCKVVSGLTGIETG